jgi:predicted acetyltransferase
MLLREDSVQRELLLRRLEPRDEGAFLRALELTEESDPSFRRYYDPQRPFGEYLALLDEVERGIELPPDHVPRTTLFGFVDGAIVGRLVLRHALDEALRKRGGHIGYAVVPAHRRRGYATEMLRQSLGFARSIGLRRVLVTCDEDNVASRRAIEKCGGVYEGSRADAALRVPKRRYWISVAERDV